MTVFQPFQDGDRNFRWIAWACVFFYAAMALVMNLMAGKSPQHQDYTRLSPRMTQLILQAAKPAPPPPVKAVKKEEPKGQEQAKEEKKKDLKPEPAKEKPVEVAKQESPTPEEIRAREEAQRKKNFDVAMNSGLLKLLKQSSPKSGADSVPDQKLKKVFSEIKGLSEAPKTAPAGTAPSVPAQSKGIDDIVAKLEKSIEDSKSTGGTGGLTGSGGINPMIGDLQKDLGGGSLAEHKTTTVKSPFQIKGFENGNSPRTYDSIAQVVDSYKGGISFLYNKSLRENPTLRGTVTVEFIIAPGGDVIDCRVTSSSMKNPPFEEALVKRILQWKFPIVPAGEVTITYPIVFSIAG
jgi:TonB family protein